MTMPPEYEPVPPPPPPPREGMSGTTKLILGLGVGCAVMLLVCCGGSAGSIYWISSLIRNSVSQDSQVIARVSDEIVTLQVPEGLKPAVSVDLQLPFNREKSIKGAAYFSPNRDNFILLGQFDESLLNEEEMRSELEDAFREQRGEQRDSEDYIVVSREPFETKINGQPATFTISHLEPAEGGGAMWQATGSFRGRGGSAVLILHLKQEQYSKDDVLEILKSLR